MSRFVRRVLSLGTTLAALACAGVATEGARAQEGDLCAPPSAGEMARVWWDACPAGPGAAELALPLPVDGAQMIFLRVTTPGLRLFSRCPGSGRSFRMGGGDVFSGERARALGGAFRDDEDWFFYLAKYELTVGQAAAILSIDDDGRARGLEIGLERLIALLEADDAARSRKTIADLAERYRRLAQSLSAARGRTDSPEVAREMARAASGLTPDEIDELADRYTEWCYRDRACSNVLERHASFEGQLGFLRLPREIEWEYAARGADLTTDELFTARLPFDELKVNEYAVLGGAKGRKPEAQVVGVGRRPTIGGFYDLFGNVSELSIDYFDMEYGEGKTGGRSARGGSFTTPGNGASAGLREEIPPYVFEDGRFLGDYRSDNLGARFAMGAIVKASEAFVREARDALAEEGCKVDSGADPIAVSIDTTAARLPEDGGREVAVAKADLEAVRRDVALRTEQLCRFLAESMQTWSALQISRWANHRSLSELIDEWKDAMRANPTERSYYESQIADTTERRQAMADSAEDALGAYLRTANAMREHGGDCVAEGFESYARDRASQRILEQTVWRSDDFTGRDAMKVAQEHARQALSGRASRDGWRREFQEIGYRLAR